MFDMIKRPRKSRTENADPKAPAESPRLDAASVPAEGAAAPTTQSEKVLCSDFVEIEWVRRTVPVLEETRTTAIAVDAGRTLLLEKDAFLRDLNQLGVSLVGYLCEDVAETGENKA